jgi:hypothetical protein
VIADAHLGLRQAVQATMAGAAVQRCRVHFLRNVLAQVPKGSVEMVAAATRTIFAQPCPRAAGRDRRDAGPAVPQARDHAPRRRSRAAGLHLVPDQPLEEGLVDQPPGTTEQVSMERPARVRESRGSPTAHRGRSHYRREPAVMARIAHAGPIHSGWTCTATPSRSPPCWLIRPQQRWSRSPATRRPCSPFLAASPNPAGCGSALRPARPAMSWPGCCTARVLPVR